MLDLQVFASPRITLKPLVPSFPCFAKILVSLMEKVNVKWMDFVFFIKIFSKWIILSAVSFALKLEYLFSESLAVQKLIFTVKASVRYVT